eukprot:snap_masked-scaffold_12-processed-gene-7.38-mRNA-1 protein AED:1.00 eAED:1.00 QI:0/-1/0/0/-1/1/1/0/179
MFKYIEVFLAFATVAISLAAASSFLIEFYLLTLLNEAEPKPETKANLLLGLACIYGLLSSVLLILVSLKVKLVTDCFTSLVVLFWRGVFSIFVAVILALVATTNTFLGVFFSAGVVPKFDTSKYRDSNTYLLYLMLALGIAYIVLHVVGYCMKVGAQRSSVATTPTDKVTGEVAMQGEV